jgi:hypothetical protein
LVNRVGPVALRLERGGESKPDLRILRIKREGLLEFGDGSFGFSGLL